MPGSSMHVIHGSIKANSNFEPRATTEAAKSRDQVPDGLTYSMERFLRDGETRAAPGLGPVQSQAEAEAGMLMQLCAFDAKFGSNSNPSSSSPGI
ncbi:hypothetical protein TARUN_2261 [Trichoderma arundinaceum]|uniref:Uncharacterized protein n=1 Tax=Trichoderma arundinaceum TaxID=490622 RepID=A0A395NV24_TRIAR|nr:hypothetical protein TARUN_2261 [Trichoderma arundinaceum]